MFVNGKHHDTLSQYLKSEGITRKGASHYDRQGRKIALKEEDPKRLTNPSFFPFLQL